MATIHSITTLTADAETLGDVTTWLRLAAQLGATGTEELLDGAHLEIEGFTPLADQKDMREIRLGDVETWAQAAEAAGCTPDARITQGGDELAVDLHVHATELIGCGDCSDTATGNDVLVTTHLCAGRAR